MKIERDERKFDFHGIGLAIKKAREREGMTQEQLGYIVDRDPRTIMYHENDGQHPSLNAFYHILILGRPLENDVGNQGAVQKRFRFRPERIALLALALGVGDQGVHEFQDVGLVADI